MTSENITLWSIKHRVHCYTVRLLDCSIMESGTNTPQYVLLLSHILIRLYKARGWRWLGGDISTIFSPLSFLILCLGLILSATQQIFINVNKYSKIIIIFIFIIAFTSLPSSETWIKIIYS